MRQITFMLLCVALSVSSFAQDSSEIISLFKGSELRYDDNIGYEKHYYLSDETTVKEIEGKMRRQFCKVPDEVSSYEIVKNYEKAIQSKGGTIIHISRNANKFQLENGDWVRFMSDKFTSGRQGHNDYAHMQLPTYAQDYVIGKVSTPENDIFISVAAVDIENRVYYELVTVLAEPMDLSNVTLNILNEGIADKGKVAIYDIYFDTGKSEIKPESKSALSVIANYLKENANDKFLIVGHTDNTGDFDANIQLSINRAKAVIAELTSNFGVSANQLKAYGIGSTSPVMSNDTKEGKDRNRRVELVEF